MKQAAIQWRRCLAASQRPADVALAEACVNLGQPQEAVAALQPHLVEAARKPDENVTILRLAAGAMLAAGQPERAEDLIGPLVATSSVARTIWLRVTAESSLDPLIASEWLARALPSIDPASADEAIAFARAASIVATRFGDPAPLRAGIDLLKPHIKPGGDVEPLFLMGSLHMQLGQLSPAEDAYRRVLAVRPDYADASNDLAYLILLRNGDMPEARKLAANAVALSPNTGTFHETLARVEAAMGHNEAAIASFDTALRLEPTNLEALIGKATLLRQTGQPQQARRLMAQIEPLLATAGTLTAPVRAQLQQLRQERSSGE